jgi:glyoxylase-like metal-dependent hydrolase (beta-lactamase superfamily II)
MGSHPEVDAHYRPRRHDLRSALADIGARLDRVTHVTNCHLHFDHCGGNPSLPDRPIFVQTTELFTARTTQDYTLPELVEAVGTGNSTARLRSCRAFPWSPPLGTPPDISRWSSDAATAT